MNEGKSATVREIKKRDDFFFATTALSSYIGKCDNVIDEAEMLEIQFDLDMMKKTRIYQKQL
ncbi:MAG: hypothetical protein R3Y47_01205 [Lachnospiraceae bacterium]